jgi:Arc/MetJ family transcription regulator
MQLTPRQFLMQFAHVAQQDLFPHLEEAVGALTPQLQLLVAVVSVLPLGRLLGARRAPTGRPARDRTALATAFIAKAILNLPTTRDLIGRLRVDAALRRLCGWRGARYLPHESKFCRAFAEFAATQLPQQMHAAVIAVTQQERLIGHIARDSTAIAVRERFPEQEQAKPKGKGKGKTQGKKKRNSGPLKSPRPKGSFRRQKASERGTRLQRQRHQKLETMLAELPQQCDIGAKTNSQGHQQYWRGYKLHLDVADGQIPISAVLTSASVHDSQVAIPLMTMTSQRVVHLYELMDSAYDADEIHAHIREQKHVPIIAPHPRRGTKKPSQLPKVFPAAPTPELTWAQRERFKERTMIERVNARLKDEFGASQVRVRGAAKVMAHLMFGVLALTVDQWLRMSTTG